MTKRVLISKLFLISLICIVLLCCIFFSKKVINNTKSDFKNSSFVDMNSNQTKERLKMIFSRKPIIGKREKELVNEVLNSGNIASGKYIENFEKTFAELSDAKHSIACCNGTAALQTALLACGIKPGDKVITTPFTFITTANSILYCGAKPIFADIDENTFNIDPKSVERILKEEKDVKAVLCVHLFGLSCDMGELLRLKEKYKFFLIEDACQSHLAKYKNRTVGSIGDAAAFSFHEVKNMTTGIGGCVLTNDSKIESLSRKIINYGYSDNNSVDFLGYNFHFTNICAAIGVAQCEQVSKWTEQRIVNAKKLSDGLKDVDFVEVPFVPEGYKHVFNQYTIKIKNGLTEKFKQYLFEQDIIPTFPSVVYLEPLYQQLGYKKGLCPVAEKVAGETVSFPMSPLFTDEDIDIIIKLIKGFKK